MLTLEQQAAFVEEAPEIFLPIPGGWGKMGHTHIRLAAASEDVLTGKGLNFACPEHQTVDANQGWLPLGVRQVPRLQTQG